MKVIQRSLLIFFISVIFFGRMPVFAEENAYKKSAYFQGEIPIAWSEYDNGFGYASESVSKEDVIGEGGGSEGYARYVSYSLSAHVVCFSDVPEERVDIFKITPELKDRLTAIGRKTGVYAEEKTGRRILSSVTFSKVPEGGIQKEYFSAPRKDGKGLVSYDLIIQYPGSPAFNKDVQHFLSTLE